MFSVLSLAFGATISAGRAAAAVPGGVMVSIGEAAQGMRVEERWSGP
jgi:hypothetical protein